MHGVYDMGAMTCFGPIAREEPEPIFHTPWERRVFALAVALCEQGLYTWNEFRDRLMAEIAAAEQVAGPDTLAVALRRMV